MSARARAAALLLLCAAAPSSGFTCPAGFWGGRGTPCELCHRGYYCARGSQNELGGSIAQSKLENLTVHGDGQSRVELDTPRTSGIVCPAGKWLQNKNGIQSCELCDPGRFCPYGSYNGAGQTVEQPWDHLCHAGYYCVAGSSGLPGWNVRVTARPSAQPTQHPSPMPTHVPSSGAPSPAPTPMPSAPPSSAAPTALPSASPSVSPSPSPSALPTVRGVAHVASGEFAEPSDEAEGTTDVPTLALTIRLVSHAPAAPASPPAVPDAAEPDADEPGPKDLGFWGALFVGAASAAVGLALFSAAWWLFIRCKRRAARLRASSYTPQVDTGAPAGDARPNDEEMVEVSVSSDVRSHAPAEGDAAVDKAPPPAYDEAGPSESGSPADAASA